MISFDFTDAPIAYVHRSIINTKAGDNAELVCDYESLPESHVVWRRDNKLLPVASSTDAHSKYTLLPSQSFDDKNEQKYRSLLVISKVEDSDLGDYECVVNNTMGESTVSLELTFVPEQPHLHNSEHDQSALITHWRIRSLEPLTEVELSYKLKDVSIRKSLLIPAKDAF